MNVEKWQKNIRIIGISLLLVSLTQKAYCTSTTCSDSIMVFLLGSIGFIFGGAALCWLANPLLIASWYFIKKTKPAMFLSAAAFIIAMLFLTSGSVLDNENGNYHPIVSYEPGYWLWLGSGLITMLGNFAIQLQLNNQNRLQRLNQN